MASGDKVFTGSIPELYDRFLIPLIFEPYAVDLAARVAKANPHNVLETAAGTGALTRAMVSRLPASVHIVATDLNQPMLDHAADRLADRRVEWRQADALVLPFPDQSFDAVACQFGVMFFPDRVQGYREARRVLKSGGQLFFSAWDRMSENDFVTVASQALAELFPHDPPRFMERAPHGYHEVDRIRADVQAAGFADVSIEAVDAKSRAASPRDAAIGYCQGNPWRGEIEARDPDGLERATEHVAKALARRFGEGPIEGRIRALVVTAGR